MVELNNIQCNKHGLPLFTVTVHEGKWVHLAHSKKMTDPVGACGEMLDDQWIGCAGMCAVAVNAMVGKLVVEDIWAEIMVVVAVMLCVGWVELGQCEMLGPETP